MRMGKPACRSILEKLVPQTPDDLHDDHFRIDISKMAELSEDCLPVL
jgi:hypothetical protein